jgi:hypothetical protein
MSEPSITFRKAVAILIAICGAPAWGCAQLLAQDSAPHWVPFVAKLVEEEVRQFQFGSPVQTTLEGIYVRNSRGATYRRIAISLNSALLVQGADEIANFHDRPHQITYMIDFTHKTIKPQSDPPDNPDFAVEPISGADFDRRHTADLNLGKQMIAGVECVGYKVADPHHKGKYLEEKWFAPPLNFLLVRYRGRLPDGGERTLQVKDLEPGKEPDPSIFVLPQGFQLVK